MSTVPGHKEDPRIWRQIVLHLLHFLLNTGWRYGWYWRRLQEVITVPEPKEPPDDQQTVAQTPTQTAPKTSTNTKPQGRSNLKKNCGAFTSFCASALATFAFMVLLYTGSRTDQSCVCIWCVDFLFKIKNQESRIKIFKIIWYESNLE